MEDILANSDTMSKPLTEEVKSIDHLVTMKCSGRKPWALTFMWTVSAQFLQMVNLLNQYLNVHV